MRVLHLSNVAGNRGGGISEVVHALTYYQNELSAHAELWFPGDEKLLAEVAERSGIPKNRLKNLKTAGDPKYGITPGIFLNYFDVLKKFDLIHQHGIWLPYSGFTCMLSRSKKTIISPHGLLEEEKFTISRKKKTFAFNLYEKYNLAGASCLVACSRQEASGFRKYGLKQPVAVIPNGIESGFLTHEYSRENAEGFKKKNGIPDDKKVLLYLSRIHPFKGLELFIRSFHELAGKHSDWVFVIAGNDEVGHKAELQKLVNDLKLNESVRFAGPQFGEDKIASMDAADCFVLPSVNENFGIVVIEALARGVPVITTKRTPWEELEDRHCGWWTEREKDKFVITLKKMFNKSAAELDRMGENGKKLVEQKYLWPSVAEQFLSLYEWVLHDFENRQNQNVVLFEE